MANISQIRQLQTPDHNIDVYPLTIEDAIFDEDGTELSSKLNDINGSILAIGGRIDDTQSDIAPVEDGSTSTRPYTVGKYLIHNDKFYKVIQAIAIDDTLIVGTNIQETKVVDEMGSSGGGGHTILNSAGSAMTQRAKLQFNGMTVTDDSTDDKTVVTGGIEISYADWLLLTPQEKASGDYYITDAPLNSSLLPVAGFDDTPTQGSYNPVTSDGIYNALNTVNGSILSISGRLADNAGAHNGIFRGKYLGNAVTSAQYDAIAAGTFEDLYIGDYWTINSVNYRIAAFDYWLHTGDTECTDHHVVLVPDTCIVNNVKMNNTNIVTGAYVGSDFYTGNNGNTGFATAKSIINAAFGSTHILNHREYLKNAATNGYESGGAWYDSTVELMTDQMVYGGKIFTNCIQGTNWAQNHTIDKSQLPLFTLEPSRICNREPWWLRDVAHSMRFARVSANGEASADYAPNNYGVRPAFAIYKPS